jgi:hypothetical protein
MESYVSMFHIFYIHHREATWFLVGMTAWFIISNITRGIELYILNRWGE